MCPTRVPLLLNLHSVDHHDPWLTLQGLRANMISRAAWHSVKPNKVTLSWRQDGDAIRISVPGGSDFGLVQIRLRQDS